MTRYKIVFSKKECIGSANCEAISPDLWKVLSDGKSELKGSKLNKATGNYELEISEAQLAKQKSVVENCPVTCIAIEKIE